MTDDGAHEAADEPRRRGGGWGPWALVAGVGAVGLLGLARELRERRRGDGPADADTDPETRRE